MIEKTQNNKNTNDEIMLENIVTSTNNALLALSQLEKSLIEAGFKEGTQAYQTMCKTLMGQRLWSLNKGNDTIDKHFLGLATVSQRIVLILQPYISSLKKLESLNGMTSDRDKVVDDSGFMFVDNEEEKAIVDILKSEDNRVSMSKLRAHMRIDSHRLRTHLENLEKSQIVSLSHGRGRMYVELLI